MESFASSVNSELFHWLCSTRIRSHPSSFCCCCCPMLFSAWSSGFDECSFHWKSFEILMATHKLTLGSWTMFMNEQTKICITKPNILQKRSLKLIIIYFYLFISILRNPDVQITSKWRDLTNGSLNTQQRVSWGLAS